MAYAATTSVFPSERRSLGVALEGTAGTGVLPVVTVPVSGTFVPEDKITGLLDDSVRSAMAATYGYTQGPYVADITIPSSVVYADTIGYFLYNILGDLNETGTASGTITTTINHSGGYAAGTSGVILVTSGGGFSAGYVQIDTTTNAEVVQITAASGTSVTISANTPTRFTHANAVAVTEVVAPFTHVFSLLNGTGNAQPPTLTLTDMNYINANLSRWYPFSCTSEVVLTGNAEKFLMWSGKAMGFANVEPGTIPTVNVSSVPGSPAWNSKVAVGGTVGSADIYTAAEWELTLTRDTSAYWTANGQQNPFTIGRGKFTSTGKLTFMPTTSEVPLDYYLNNSQPQTQIIAYGTSGASMQIDIQVGAFLTDVIDPSKSLLGYNATLEAIANTTNTGWSAGYSPLKITLINSYATYAQI